MPRRAKFFVAIVLLLLAALPVLALFSRDARGQWVVNRTLMAEPDEPSYVLMARSIVTRHGFSTAPLTGRDTFYPAGFPLVLAGWSKVAGFSLESLHVCVALTLSGAIVASFFLLRRMFTLWHWPNPHWPALVVTVLFATSWHTLENGLYVFSEPLFSLLVFLWLLAALKLDEWWARPRAAAAVAALACAAALVRTAGVVCIAAVVIYIGIGLVRHRAGRLPRQWRARWLALASTGVVVAAFVAVSALLSPRPGADVPHQSYTQQFLARLDGGLFAGMWERLQSLGASLIPEPWDKNVDEVSYFYGLSFLLVVPALLGLFKRLLRSGRGPTRFVEIFFAIYILLFLLWPFTFVRFWIPVLPLTLAYAAEFLRHVRLPLRVALPACLLALNVFQGALRFPGRQERLIFVSDSLAAAARSVAPSGKSTVCVDNEDYFTFSWYLGASPDASRARVVGPKRGERIESLILRQLDSLTDPSSHLYVASYFKHDPHSPGEPTLWLVLQNLQREHPKLLGPAGRYTITRVHQIMNITAVWIIVPNQAWHPPGPTGQGL